MLNGSCSNSQVKNTQCHHSHSVTTTLCDSVIDARHYSNIRRKYCCPGSTKYLKLTKKTNRQQKTNACNQPISIHQTQWINTATNNISTAISHVISFVSVTMIRILQIIVIFIKMSVVALLTVIAFTLRVIAYVVDFLLIDSIWLLIKLCLYALISSNVARLYEADTPIAVFGVFKVIVFLMECTSVNAVLIAFTLKIVAYVVGFLLIDGIWVSARLSLYALFSVKVACLYEVDTPIVVFGMFQVIVFLMECPSVNAMPMTEQERRDRRNARKRMKRQKETPEDRSKRLRSEQERMASTSHQRNERRQSKRQSESNEHRAERLANRRESRSNISQQQNQRRQAQRHSETNEQRAQHRLDERERWTDRRQQRTKGVDLGEEMRMRMKVTSGEVPIA